MMYLFLGLFFGVLAVNLKRANKNIKFKLTHNCLMTKHPIVFVPGPSSLFYFFKYWNNIPNYLKEHGYEIIELKLSPLALLMKRKYTLKALEKLSRKYKKIHTVFDPSQIAIANSIAEENLSYLKSIHIFSQSNISLYLDKRVTHHHISNINDKITHSKEDYLKIAHDMFTQSPLFVPEELLGAKSKGKQLTVEPQFLKEVIKIAENDWHQ